VTAARVPEDRPPLVAVPDLPADQMATASHDVLVGGEQTTPEGQVLAVTHYGRALRGQGLPIGPVLGVTQGEIAGGDQATPEGHHCRDTQEVRALRGSDSPASHQISDTQARRAGGGSTSPEGHTNRGPHNRRALRGPFLRDAFLGSLAQALDDVEQLRKATANRYWELTTTEKDDKGVSLGKGLPYDHPDVTTLRNLLFEIGPKEIPIGKEQDPVGKKKKQVKLKGPGGVEHTAIKALEARLRTHPLWETWGRHTMGVGPKQFGRLLGALGDPYWNERDDCPRTVSALMKYCGFDVADGVAPRKQKGQKAGWSSAARMRMWNISQSVIKTGKKSPHYELYVATKAHYEDALHSRPCPRCTKQGKPPAPVGSPLTKAHIAARGERAISKAMLKELWRASRDLHEASDPLRN